MPFPDGIADFRSDTVTVPTAAMRQAMATAVVGDDVYGDDPTVNRLEEEAAAIVGKEAAVFVPTGTMANQLAVAVQTLRGEEVLCDEGAHLRNVERGAASAMSGVSFRTVAARGGRITPQMVSQAMELAGSLFPRIKLMVWENSHNLSGGQVIPLSLMTETGAAAHKHGLSVHLDGARIFNAAIALEAEPKEIAQQADTVSFCFSKGLGAPVGSILCGTDETMTEVRYLRKRWGGAMRQVGVLAAPAQIALSEWERLDEDHRLAQRLGAMLAERFPKAIDMDTVQTNMVNIDIEAMACSYQELTPRLEAEGIRTNPPFGNIWRLVTHRDVNLADVERLVGVISTIA